MIRPFDIRILGEQDIASLRAMLSMFGTAFEDVATYAALQPDDSYLQRLLKLGVREDVLHFDIAPSAQSAGRQPPCHE